MIEPLVMLFLAWGYFSDGFLVVTGRIKRYAQQWASYLRTAKSPVNIDAMLDSPSPTGSAV